MNPIHFTFKHGWIFLVMSITLTLLSVFVQFGPQPIIAQWDPQPIMNLSHKAILFLSGGGLIVIALFRVSERLSR